MKIPIYQIDAFTENRFSGNPAAVCPLSGDWLPDETLQNIASENNLAETSFYLKRDDGYHLRWFTPTIEVNLCGHATLAAAHVVFTTEKTTSNEVVFHSKSGPLPVTRLDDGMLELNFPIQPIETCDCPQALLDGLESTPLKCYRCEDYVAVFETEADILALNPDFRILKNLDSRGLIATAPGVKSDFVSRFFAPQSGVDEDPVTGSAHCALAPYWAGELGKQELTATQVSKRGGYLNCRVAEDRVFIAGNTVSYLEGTIEID